MPEIVNSILKPSRKNSQMWIISCVPVHATGLSAVHFWSIDFGQLHKLHTLWSIDNIEYRCSTYWNGKNKKINWHPLHRAPVQWPNAWSRMQKNNKKKRNEKWWFQVEKSCVGQANILYQPTANMFDLLQMQAYRANIAIYRGMPLAQHRLWMDFQYSAFYGTNRCASEYRFTCSTIVYHCVLCVLWCTVDKLH